MINRELLNPSSIVVIGASNDIRKPGGKMLKNIIDHDYRGQLFVVNPKAAEIQGVKSYPDAESLPQTELAILAVPAAACPALVRTLTQEKGTRAFIIISAGFSEENAAGAAPTAAEYNAVVARANALTTLVNELRDNLVSVGLIKGSA